MLRAFGVSETGRVRSTNEDCFSIDEPLQLCLVADGLGGHRAGEIASRLAVDTILAYLRRPRAGSSPLDTDAWPYGLDTTLSSEGNLLRTALFLANGEVLRVAGTDADYAGMGTTVVGAWVSGGRLAVAHVGDSRLYVMADGTLRLLTEDDSWLTTAGLSQLPGTDMDTLRQHPLRNALTNVVGTRTSMDVHVSEEALAGGEVLLLSTDGLHGVLSDADIRGFLMADTGLDAVARSLVDAALDAGSRDNVTALVARWDA